MIEADKMMPAVEKGDRRKFSLCYPTKTRLGPPLKRSKRLETVKNEALHAAAHRSCMEFSATREEVRKRGTGGGTAAMPSPSRFSCREVMAREKGVLLHSCLGATLLGNQRLD